MMYLQIYLHVIIDQHKVRALYLYFSMFSPISITKFKHNEKIIFGICTKILQFYKNGVQIKDGKYKVIIPCRIENLSLRICYSL